MNPSDIPRTAWQALRRFLRKPDRLWSQHTLALFLAAVPAAVLLYVLALVPFTPAISDIRKAKTDQPAQLVSSDGRLLAEYKWVNREWVPLDAIAPAVVDALIATEDHRFYEHFGLDWRRTLSAVVRTAGATGRAARPSRSSLRATCIPRRSAARPRSRASSRRRSPRSRSSGAIPRTRSWRPT